MSHRAYIHKMTMNQISLWVAVIKDGTGKHRRVEAVITHNSFEYIIGQAVRRVRLLDELRGIFPDGDGKATIERLPDHCLWCGELLLLVGPGEERLTCNANHGKKSRNRLPYRPERCRTPIKRKYIYRGTAICMARRIDPVTPNCYRCSCGTYHLTRANRGELKNEVTREEHLHPGSNREPTVLEAVALPA